MVRSTLDIENYRSKILSAHDRISEYIHNTPLLSSSAINKISGANLYFKCENFQKIGAFKMRGAINAVEKTPYEKKKDNGRNEARTKLKLYVLINCGIKGPIIFVINDITKKTAITKTTSPILKLIFIKNHSFWNTLT